MASKLKIVQPFNFDIKVKLSPGSITSLDKQVSRIIGDIMEEATVYIMTNFQSLVIDRLVYGGQGWYGIVNTPMWDYVSSKRGAGEIGFTSHLQKYSLLVAYLDSWQIKKIRGGGFEFMFGDITVIRRATKHPAAGIGKLPSNRSWFDWLCINEFYVEKEPAAFLKTGKKGARSYKVAGSEAGIMKKFGFFKRHKNTEQKALPRKSWHPPTKALFSPERLLNKNKVKITSVIRQVYFDYLYKATNEVES